jgi:hypothetical protein
MWVVGIGMGDYFGMSFSQASSLSAAAAFCGLASWLTYHIVGRQNNGLIMIMSQLALFVREDQTHSLSALVVTFLPFGVAMGGFFGLAARGLDTRRARKRAAAFPGPLYDAQHDHPA